MHVGLAIHKCMVYTSYLEFITFLNGASKFNSIPEICLNKIGIGTSMEMKCCETILIPPFNSIACKHILVMLHVAFYTLGLREPNITVIVLVQV